MPAEVSEAAPPARSGAATRARILTAAGGLFYAQGIRATSADRIIDEVGLTKVTFYRHFRTKSDLVVAYLEQQSAAEQAWLVGVRDPADSAGSLQRLAGDIGEASCQPGFRGCAFINAAAEFPDDDDPVRVAVDAHRSWTLDYLADIATDAGVEDSRGAARRLMLLRDGAMVNGYLGDAETVAGTLRDAFASVLATALR